MPVLGRHMQRGDTLAVSEPAECGFVIDGRTVIDQVRGRFHTVAPSGPNERSSAIGIGVQTRSGSKKPGKNLCATALAGPDKRLVQNLLLISGRSPIRESTMRSIKSPRCTSLGRQGCLSVETPLDRVFIT